MKFLHIADLHLGKSIYGVSLLEEDQAEWVRRFLDLSSALHPDAVLIAGDVYDRSAPSGEAVALLDRLLTGLTDQGIQVFVISGNHDSGRRLGFASSLLCRQGVHIAGEIGEGGILRHVTLEDAYGPVTVWLMPYLFPLEVSELLGDPDIRDYETAVRRLLALQPMDPSQRNILVGHQNVTAFGKEGERGGSESMVGGIGQIDYTCFDAFDYTALGHIHAAYAVGRRTVRYAGSPLCYHFDETRQSEKGPLLVTLGPKGETPQIELKEIPALHPLRIVEDTWDEITARESVSENRGEYISVRVTDRAVTPDMADYLNRVYQARDSRLLEIISTWRAISGGDSSGPSGEAVRAKSIDTLFSDFYADRHSGSMPSPGDSAFLAQVAGLMASMDSHDISEESVIGMLTDILVKQTEEEEKAEKEAENL